MAQIDLTAADVVRAWRDANAKFHEMVANDAAKVERDHYVRLGLTDALLGVEQYHEFNGYESAQERYQRGYALGVEARRLMEENRNAD